VGRSLHRNEGIEDVSNYFGLAPKKAVGLKYQGGNLFCDEIVKKSPDGKVLEINCTLDNSEGRKKPKSHITWVPYDALPCEVRVYENLFTVPVPTDLWEEELNPESETIFPDARVDPSVCSLVDAKDVDHWISNRAFQFERIGYFVVDTDTTYDSESGTGALVFNRTVSLKESKGLDPLKEERRLKDKADKEAKEARMKIPLVDLFRKAPEYDGKYSKYDEKGIPTHYADGSDVKKSMVKKLQKERVKHEKALNKHNTST